MVTEVWLQLSTLGSKQTRLTFVGREHALAWKLSQSPRLSKLWVAPGNGGTSRVPKAENVPYLKPGNFEDLLVFARESMVDLVIVGPEAPLVGTRLSHAFV